MARRPDRVQIGTRRRASERRSALESPFATDQILRRIRVLNAQLRSEQSPLRVPRPSRRRGLDDERERVSRVLMVVLRERRCSEAIELLYLLNQRVLEAFCRARARGHGLVVDAADAVDETFLTLMTKAAMFRPTERSSFTGWMFVIAENIMRQWQRKRRRDPMIEHGYVREPEDQGADPWALVSAREVRDTHLRAIELFVRLAAAGLLQLPATWRRALELRESEGRSYREIGAALSVSANHAGMIIRRARLKVLDVVATALRGEARRPK